MASAKPIRPTEIVKLVINRRALNLIRSGSITILPVYRSEWSLNKFIDNEGFERSFKYIQFLCGNLPDADTILCNYQGINISSNDYYLRLGKSTIRVFPGDLIIKFDKIAKI